MLNFKNILVHYDSRSETHPALDFAAKLAVANEGKLKIIEMIPDFSWPTRQFLGNVERVIENITQAKKHHVEEVAAPLRDRGIDVTTKVLDGRTSVAMIREVLRDNHDLVIRTAKGTHSRRAGFFGTTATRLLRKCPCPVLILRPDHPCRCERVVAAVSATSDDELHSKLNKQIIQLAREVTSTGPPEIVTAWSIYGESILKNHMEEDEFDDVRERTRNHTERKLDDLLMEFDLGVGHDNVQLLEGEPGQVIPQFIHEYDADLLVMGTVARSGIAGLLTGNTAEQILDCVECSVLAVKPEGFVSPIRL